MRNIIELIGIIKGVNFDGVINEKEVIDLQNWVDKNRNLAYEPKQIEMINLVDQILEDHVIDDHEKKLLISYAEKYLLESDESNTKIYELDGIIEGIICDGEINESEVINLKQWMDDNGDLIKTHSSNQEIAETIENILEDGIVTEEEQDNLLSLLSEKIQDSQLESKIDYLCKLVKQRKNIGVEIIDILDNEKSIFKIHKRAEEQLIRALNSYSGFCANREIIVVSLVLIAMLEYDGNYYENVRNTYLDAYDRYSEQKVEGFIRSVLSVYKPKEDFNNRVRIINVALENAIVPQEFLPAFFEFIFDIYKLNFDYDLSDDLSDDFRFVYEGLRNNLLSDGDDLSLNVTQKTYKLIASTKKLLTREEGIEAVISLSILIVKLIDKRYWNKEVKLLNPYLKSGYDVWEKLLTEKAEGIHRSGSSELKSRWEPKFTLANNAVMLVPPIHRVKSQYDYKYISIIVENDGEEIYRNNRCDIREIIGGYQINTPLIKLDKPLGKLKYKLVCGEQTIYESKEKLFRNFIVFDTRGQEINNNTDYEGNATVVFRKDDCELDIISYTENYCLGYKLARIGDTIRIGNDVFNFSALIKPGVFGTLHKNCFVHDLDSETYIPIYKDMNVIVFEADSSINKFEITINNKSYKLSEMNYKTTCRNNIIKYVVELSIDHSGLYDLEVNQIKEGKKTRILRVLFAYDNELFYSTDKIDDDSYKIELYSELIGKIIETEIAATAYDIDLVKCNINEKEYSIIVPFDFGFYKIDDNNWQPMTEDIWIDDVDYDTELILLDSDCDGLYVYNDKGSLIEDNVSIVDKGFYKIVSIGFLNSYKTGNLFETLVFTVDGKKKIVLQCFNKCVIDKDKTEISMSNESKKINITPIFRGKDKVFFEVFNCYGEQVFQSKLLRSGQTDCIVDFNSFEKYIIRFHEKTKVLQLRKNSLLMEEEKIFYAKEDFVGRSLKISEIYYLEPHPGLIVDRNVHLHNSYVQVTNIKDKDIFTGNILIRKKNADVYLDEINPVEIELCGDIVGDSIEVYIVNEEDRDGLLYDEHERIIMNTLVSKKAPDIYSYTLDLKGNN